MAVVVLKEILDSHHVLLLLLPLLPFFLPHNNDLPLTLTVSEFHVGNPKKTPFLFLAKKTESGKNLNCDVFVVRCACFLSPPLQCRWQKMKEASCCFNAPVSRSIQGCLLPLFLSLSWWFSWREGGEGGQIYWPLILESRSSTTMTSYMSLFVATQSMVNLLYGLMDQGFFSRHVCGVGCSYKLASRVPRRLVFSTSSSSSFPLFFCSRGTQQN